MPEFVSELIGKPLLTRKGEYRGCVKNVQTDARLLRIRNLECFDAEEEEFLLPASAVAQFGQDALIVKGGTPHACKNCVPLPFKCSAYTQTGDALGVIDDFARDGLAITGILLSDGELRPTAGAGKIADAALFGARPAARKATAPPAGKRAGQALLTGKILPEALTDVRGNVLAPAGTRVTAEVIRRAMAHGKLFALTLLCTRGR